MQMEWMLIEMYVLYVVNGLIFAINFSMLNGAPMHDPLLCPWIDNNYFDTIRSLCKCLLFN